MVPERTSFCNDQDASRIIIVVYAEEKMRKTPRPGSGAQVMKRRDRMATIAFAEVSKAYKGTSSPAVDAVSFEVPDGAICMLLGTSGSGKTTLLRMVNRLIEPTAGAI